VAGYLDEEREGGSVDGGGLMGNDMEFVGGTADVGSAARDLSRDLYEGLAQGHMDAEMVSREVSRRGISRPVGGFGARAFRHKDGRRGYCA
jgi:hypothetical protein